MSQLALFGRSAPAWVPQRGALAWYRDGGRWASMLVLGVEGELVRGATNEGTRVFALRDLHARLGIVGGRRG